MFSLFKAFSPEGTKDILTKRLEQLYSKYKGQERTPQGVAVGELAVSHFKINKIPIEHEMSFVLEMIPFILMDFTSCKKWLPEYLLYRMPNQRARNAVDLQPLQEAINNAITSPSQTNSFELQQALALIADRKENLTNFVVFGRDISWIAWLDIPAKEKLFDKQDSK